MRVFFFLRIAHRQNKCLGEHYGHIEWEKPLYGNHTGVFVRKIICDVGKALDQGRMKDWISLFFCFFAVEFFVDAL